MTIARNDVNHLCRGDYLVPDVLSRAFDFLDFDNVLGCMQTCTRWWKVARDHSSFSTEVILEDLVPGHYNLFVTRLAHKQRIKGPLEITLYLRAFSVLPPNLFAVLKAAWSRVRTFHLETSDISGTLSFLNGLESPSLYTLVINFILPPTTSAQPLLPKNFLGGHAPNLHRLRIQDVGFSDSKNLRSALNTVGQLQASALEPDSIALIPELFPELYSLRIVDPIAPHPVPLTRASEFARYDNVEYLIINLQIAPHWILNLLPLFPLATMKSISLIGSPDVRRPIPSEAFEMILDAMPGNDLCIQIATSSDVEENVIASAGDGDKAIVRSLNIRDLHKFSVPARIAVRIIALEIETPDWDRTWFWSAALVSLERLFLVFPSASVFSSLLNKPAYRRLPVPIPFIQYVAFQVVDALEEPEVEFGELYRWLRAGTLEPPPPSHERFFARGIRVTGSALSKDRRELHMSECEADGTLAAYPITEEEKAIMREAQRLTRESALKLDRGRAR